MNATPEHGLAVVTSLLGALALVSTDPASAAKGPTPQVRTRAIKVGNPMLKRWPLSDPGNARARSIWDMHLFGGRIYIGSGDY